MKDNAIEENAPERLAKPVEKLDAPSPGGEGKSWSGDKDAIEHVRVQVDPALTREKHVLTSPESSNKNAVQETGSPSETVGKRWVPGENREHGRVQLDPALTREKYAPPNRIPESADVLATLAQEQGAQEGRQLHALGVVGGESVTKGSKPATTPVDQERLSKNIPATRR